MIEPEDYAVQRLRDALAADERVAEMGVHVRIAAGKVFLTGQVPTEETDPRWLFKGFKDEIMVDVIFRSTGDIYLDEEMLAHARVADVRGCAARVIAPEDLLLIKALTADEHMPHHWHDALGVITGSELDWDYLVSRARRHGARRVLSLLLYAQSNDLGVPVKPVRALFDAIYDA